MITPFDIIEPKAPLVPLIISIPHVGTMIPDDLKGNYVASQLQSLDDTDWFLDRLYSFASDLGITIIKAKYHRWVVDLNRDPESKPLYTDGRIITGLCSTTDFLGNPIYKEDKEPDAKEIERRVELYYKPYYKAITGLLEARKNEFGNALLWDAHSIRAHVPTIREEPFPEMILGNADETTADPILIQTALNCLAKGYEVAHNHPFKGGFITRSFGNPKQHIHALQLERNKNLYMDDAEVEYSEVRANEMELVLRKTLEELIQQVLKLPK